VSNPSSGSAAELLRTRKRSRVDDFLTRIYGVGEGVGEGVGHSPTTRISTHSVSVATLEFTLQFVVFGTTLSVGAGGVASPDATQAGAALYGFANVNVTLPLCICLRHARFPVQFTCLVVNSGPSMRAEVGQ